MGGSGKEGNIKVESYGQSGPGTTHVPRWKQPSSVSMEFGKKESDLVVPMKTEATVCHKFI